MTPGRSSLDRGWLLAEAVEVAPRLLNLLLVCGAVVARIVEVEAYAGADDAASHAYRGRTARNETMFGPPGHLYVYLTYGMHHCANVSCGPVGTAQAVLLRAGAPVAGLEEMRARRAGAKRDVELCAGPGRLCAALGIDRRSDGTDLLDAASPVQLCADGTPPPTDPQVGPRIGLSARAGDAAARPWRFAVPGHPSVSRPFARGAAIG